MEPSLFGVSRVESQDVVNTSRRLHNIPKPNFFQSLANKLKMRLFLTYSYGAISATAVLHVPRNLFDSKLFKISRQVLLFSRNICVDPFRLSSIISSDRKMSDDWECEAERFNWYWWIECSLDAVSREKGGSVTQLSQLRALASVQIGWESLSSCLKWWHQSYDNELDIRGVLWHCGMHLGGRWYK